MCTLGIDIGSATTKVLILSDGKIKFSSVIPTHPDLNRTVASVREIVEGKGYSIEEMRGITATGYGRVKVPFANKVVTEISCHARGAHWLYPSARTIIDIGGQDSKVIRLDETGRVADFQMNDKCAAGTGRFLDNMARVLQVELSELGPLSLTAGKKVQISSICTVFAESEVISQIATGTPWVEIIAGLHEAITERIYGMAGRVGIIPDVAMTGGVARNQGVVKSFEEKTGYPILVPEDPQIVGALGAALIAAGT